MLGLGLYLFVELCPPEIVEEHMEALSNKNVIPGEWRDADVVNGEIIDADFHEEE